MYGTSKRDCEWCGLEFEAKRIDAKFCSKKCRVSRIKALEDCEGITKEYAESCFSSVGVLQAELIVSRRKTARLGKKTYKWLTDINNQLASDVAFIETHGASRFLKKTAAIKKLAKRKSRPTRKPVPAFGEDKVSYDKDDVPW